MMSDKPQMHKLQPASDPERQARDSARRDRAGSCSLNPLISGQPKLLADHNSLQIAKLNHTASTSPSPSPSAAHPTKSPLNARASASLLASSPPCRPKTVHVCEGADAKMRNVLALSTTQTHLPYLFFGTLPTPLLPPDYPHHLSCSHTNGKLFLADPHMRDHLGVGKQYKCCFYCWRFPMLSKPT
ncbi:hypothetical protein L7F22_018356 [Adiantum nelumboides]|nr:hypothetical protein [Adiantum nelumboides]